MDGTQPHLLPDSTPLSHEDVARFLPAYVAEQLAGGSPEARFPLVAAHLATCTACRIDLDELLVLTNETYTDQSPLPSVYPEFQLPPLEVRLLTPEEPRPAGRWRRSGPGAWVLTLTSDLLALGRAPLLTGAARADDLLYHLQVPPEDTGPELRVEVFGTVRDEVYLRLVVDTPELDALDMAGVVVMAKAGEHIWRARTDEIGMASMRGIPRPALEGLELEVIVGQSA